MISLVQMTINTSRIPLNPSSVVLLSGRGEKGAERAEDIQGQRACMEHRQS